MMQLGSFQKTRDEDEIIFSLRLNLYATYKGQFNETKVHTSVLYAETTYNVLLLR